MYRGKRYGNVLVMQLLGDPNFKDMDDVMSAARDGHAAAGPLVCLVLVTEETRFPSLNVIAQMVLRQKELSAYQRSAHFVYIHGGANATSHKLRTSRFQAIVTQFILAGGGNKLDDKNDGALAALHKAQKHGPLTYPPEEIIRLMKQDGFPVE